MKQFSIDIETIVCYNHNDMKYLFNKLTNLIVLLLVLSLACLLFGCGEEVEERSVEETQTSNEFTLEIAKELVARDRLITEIFVCNSLCVEETEEAVRTLVPADSEYAEFASITSLIDTTYTKESIEKEFFYSYPEKQIPAVVSENGKTSVFKHSGGGFDDFANAETITIANTDNDYIKDINLTTTSGKTLTLHAVLQDGAWLLEKGLYLSHPREESEFYARFNESNVGSLKTLNGKILVIEMFISDSETEITDAEEDAFHAKVSSVIDRLVLNASEYGASPVFETDKGHFEHESVLGTRVLDFDLMFAETGFGTLRAFAEANYKLSDYDSYCFVVYIDKDIKTSVGRYDNTEDTDLYYAERVLTGKKSTESEIYKSMLKMFGAYGYDEGVFDKYTESLYHAYFPNDCMSESDMTLSVMSPVVAYSCGVTDELKNLYRVFIPNN